MNCYIKKPIEFEDGEKEITFVLDHSEGYKGDRWQPPEPEEATVEEAFDEDGNEVDLDVFSRNTLDEVEEECVQRQKEYRQEREDERIEKEIEKCVYGHEK